MSEQAASAQQPQYVLRLVQRSEIPIVAQIQHDAFDDPTNTTPDELAFILNAEPDPELGRALTRDENIAKLIKYRHEDFDAHKYSFVGVYRLPASLPSTFPTGKGEDVPSTTLPEGSQLVGFAMWQRVDQHTVPETPKTDKKAAENPNLLNAFFAQMNRTRESTMQGKTYWFLKILSIDPEHQRKGLGTLLVKWGVERANKEGVDAWLESSPMGKGAYLKAGFRVLGMDRVDEPRAKKGYLEWPYMIHEFKPQT